MSQRGCSVWVAAKMAELHSIRMPTWLECVSAEAAQNPDDLVATRLFRKTKDLAVHRVDPCLSVGDHLRIFEVRDAISTIWTALLER